MKQVIVPVLVDNISYYDEKPCFPHIIEVLFKAMESILNILFINLFMKVFKISQ